MKFLAKVLILATLLSVVLSWGAIFERFGKLREKETEIKEKLDLKRLRDFSLKDLMNLESLGIGSNLEKLKHIVPKELDSAHHKDIEEYWSGAFEYLKLKKPTELIDCFGTVSGNLFFRKIRTVNDLLKNSKENNNIKLHTDYAQLEMIMQALEHTRKCVANTQDYERLTDSLDISKDPEELMAAKYLYYEAKYAELAEPFEAIVKEIDAGNFNKAGRLFAEMFKKSIKDYKNTGEDLLQFQAFGNGVSGTLGTSLPSESLKCYNAKQAKISMDFVRKLTSSVAGGSWYKAEDSITEFWKTEGQDLLDKIPAKVYECNSKSKETKEISEKLGSDLYGEEFKEKMWEYVSDHNIRYYSYVKSMYKATEKNDYLHAGVAYAHLLEAVAKNQ